MYGVVLAIHLIVCFGLVAVILVQSGKGGGLAGGAFGAQAQTVFGGRGANDFITRATIALGVLFFVTSFSLAVMTSHGGAGRSHSLIQDMAKKSAAAGSAQPTRGSAPAQGRSQGAAPLGSPSSAPAPGGAR